MFKNTLRWGITLGSLSLVAVQAQALPIDGWEPRSTGTAIPSAIHSSPVSADHVWLGYSNGDVFFSTDGRSAAPSWNRLDSASDGRGGVVNTAPGLAVKSISPIWSFDSYSAIVVFAGTQQGGKVWRVDYNRGGLQWNDLTAKIPAGEVLNVSLNTRAGILYFATTAGMVYSFDNGTTFTTVRPQNDPFQPPTEAAVSAVDVNPTINQAVVGTTNGEVWLSFNPKYNSKPTWTKISTWYQGRTLPAQMVTSVAIDSRDASAKTFQVSFAGRIPESIWRTVTGGQFWVNNANPNIPQYGNGVGTIVGSVGISPAPGASTLYAMTEYGAFRSDDNGDTWFASARWSGKNIAAEYKHSDINVIGNQLYPNIRFRNLGSVAVQAMGTMLRYRYTKEGSSPESYYLDYSPYSVTRSFSSLGSDRVLDLRIASNATIPVGGVSGEIQGRIAKSDWSNFDQSNDFSYLQAASTWTRNPYIAIYVGGNQVWGAFAR